MTSKQAMKSMENYQMELNDLVTKRAEVQTEVDALQGERLVAVKHFAVGKGPESAIVKLDHRIAPLSTRLEGLTGLISDATSRVYQAQAVLREAQELEKQEAVVFCRGKEMEKCASLLKGLNQHEQRIEGLYRDLCLELAQYGIDSERCGVSDISDQRFKLANRIQESLFKKGYRKALGRGYGGTGYFEIHAMLVGNGDPTLGSKSFSDLCRDAIAKDHQQWSQEWRRSQGLE